MVKLSYDKWEEVSGVSLRTCKLRIGDYRRRGELLSNISEAGPDMSLRPYNLPILCSLLFISEGFGDGQSIFLYH